MMSYEKLDVYRCSIQFLAIAIEITGECGAAMDVCKVLQLIDEKRIRHAKEELLHRIVSMLTKSLVEK